MTDDVATIRIKRSHLRWAAWILAAAVVVAIVVGYRVHAAHEQAVRVDTLYCTLSGITAFEIGPNTGELCGKLLVDAGLG